jgi:hypothetical protein
MKSDVLSVIQIQYAELILCSVSTPQGGLCLSFVSLDHLFKDTRSDTKQRIAALCRIAVNAPPTTQEYLL